MESIPKIAVEIKRETDPIYEKVSKVIPKIEWAFHAPLIYKINMLNKTEPNWIGSRICVKKYLKSPQWLRGLKFKKRPFWRLDKIKLNNIIENGGWHFANLKTPEKLLYKYENMCETKDNFVFNRSIDKKYLNLEKIKENIKDGKDIIGRKDIYEKIEIDNSFPDYIIKNKSLFKDWII